MTKNMIKKLIAVALTLTLFVSVCGLLISSAFINSMKGHAFESIKFEETYEVGDILVFPEAQVEGTTAETVLYYPDGAVKKTNSEKFAIPGNYTIEYRALVNDAMVKKSFNISVLQAKYSTTSTLATTEYVKESSTWKKVITDPERTSYMKMTDEEYTANFEGLKVTLPRGTTFTYNKILNLYDLKGIPCITFAVIPSVQGERDMRAIEFKFTDVYDPNNVVTVLAATVHPVDYGAELTRWRHGTTDFFAGTQKSEMYGLNGNGDYSSANTDHRYGFSTQLSFSGCGYSNIDQEYQTVGFDLENKLVMGGYGKYVGGKAISDLSDDYQYSTAWQGFTTGDVIMSISCSEYLKNSATLLITQIGDDNLQEFTTKGGCKSTLDVDMQGYQEGDLPHGTVGKSYPLLTATSYDYYKGKCEVAPRVFYNYTSSTRYEVSTSNGKFVPTKEGTYTMLFKVEDSFGGSIEKTIDFVVDSDLKEIVATLPQGYQTTAKAGENTQVAKPIVSGGTGKIYEKVTATIGSETVEIKDYKFIPSAGNYVIKYEYTDFIGTKKTIEYNLEVQNNSAPVSNDTIYLPKLLIEGKQIQLPDCDFYDYSGQTPVKVDYNITVIDGDGEHVLSDNLYRVKQDASGKVTFRYWAEKNGQKGYLDDIVVNVREIEGDDGLILPSLFNADPGITINTLDAGLSIKAMKDGKVEFINPVLASVFETNFKFIKTGIKFDKFNIYVKDSIDESICLKLSLKNKLDDKGTILIALNDKTVSITPARATFYNETLLNIRYNNNKFDLGSYDKSFKIKDDMNGKEFNGFPSQKVYVSFEFEGVYASGGEILLSNINNQPLNNSILADGINTQIQVNGDFILSSTINQKAVICSATVSDVIDTYSKVSITVTQKGAYVKADDGTVLNNAPNKEYVITLDNYGQYQVAYSYSDSVNDEKKLIKNITVYDFEAPEIYVEGDVMKTAKVGDAIKLPTASAEDNVTKDLVVSIFVYEGDNGRVYKEGMTFEKQGTCVIRYFVCDEAGNTAVKVYKINVVGGNK